MASESQMAANRRNARKRTGPPSRGGKRRVSKNALRHGLSVPFRANAAEAGLIEELAEQIAGPRHDRIALELARAARSPPLISPVCPPGQNTTDKARIGAGIGRPAADLHLKERRIGLCQVRPSNQIFAPATDTTRSVGEDVLGRGRRLGRGCTPSAARAR